MDLQLIADYGVYFYFLVFIWTFFEGETIVLFAGFAAAQGLLDPLLLLVCAGLGSYLGDQCYFWLGRNYGVRLLNRFPGWRPGVENALSWLERYDVWFILSFRFIYGVRNFSSFALGLSAVRWERFLRLNFLAAMVWAASFVAIGYFLAALVHGQFEAWFLSFGPDVSVYWGVIGMAVGGITREIEHERNPRMEAATRSRVLAPATVARG